MQVAIPIWDQRISPVLDAASSLWLTKIDDESQTIHWQIKVSLLATQPTTRAREIAELGINVLICGAVSQFLEQLLRSQGIQVITRKCGMASQVLDAYRQGQLDDIAYALPGCQSHQSPASIAKQCVLDETIKPRSIQKDS